MPVVEVVGWVGSGLLVLSLTQTRVMRFRVLNLVACVVLVAYNAVIGVWPMVAMNVVLTAINLGVIVTLLRRRHDARAYVAVPVGVGEPLLAHLLERHGKDVRRFWPGATEDLLGAAEHAFVVTSGDQLVGVVLSRAGAATDEQQVLLDYVVPAFRDFTPGEFVYRTDGPFAELGTRRLVACPRAAATARYLSAMGFTREGDRLVLTRTG
ncbi:hypothetical protein [Cellulomonas bogoriensis]|uniref:YgjV family protein n=1 Tax=Cellulomonas bogoriensis 69B4 = DSM 16987 TaxID=1386082 RepID=A0A0A0BZL3_9CELL|nr:hypothetical protein [Cellulomonas bogoriensis]KGM13366.1 hypothetical protein N869_14520 [Cellulomonas bogoriensis 69B4 = DSM 16987]